MRKLAYFFVKMALRAISWQSNEKHKLGCIVTNKVGRVLSTGYNKRYKNGHLIHAEVMALSKLTVEERYGAIVYCSWSPCKYCEQYMRDYGVSHVIYEQEYKGNRPAPHDLCEKF